MYFYNYDFQRKGLLKLRCVDNASMFCVSGKIGIKNWNVCASEEHDPKVMSE